MPSLTLDQRPAPHSRIVRHTGDTLRVTLHLSQPMQGKAWLRTNLGNAAILDSLFFEAIRSLLVSLVF